MNMTNRTLFLLLFSLGAVVACGENVEVTVTNDSGDPVEGSIVDVWYLGHLESGKDDVKKTGFTNSSGKVKKSGVGKNSIRVVVSKAGWYRTETERLSPGKDYQIEMAIRERRIPIPLVVREMDLVMPEENIPIGFDLEVGDWTAPYGKGKVADFTFEMRREFKGYDLAGKALEDRIQRSKKRYAATNRNWTLKEFQNRAGKWDANVTMRILTEGGGFYDVEDAYLPNSELSMPHEAPEDGYERVLELEGSTYSQARAFARETGRFLRTRVQMRDGEIVRANYAKIVGGIKIQAGHAKVQFVYYFNPTPNNRNLEFDPDSNLADDQSRHFPP